MISKPSFVFILSVSVQYAAIIGFASLLGPGLYEYDPLINYNTHSISGDDPSYSLFLYVKTKFVLMLSNELRKSCMNELTLL